FLTEKPGARSDLEALAALDSNRDRKIDATDLRFGELKVWVDSNRNGVTDAGELKTLTELNIASIDLASTPTQQKVKVGDNILLATGSFTLADGTVRSLGDAALAFEPARGSASFVGAAGDAFDLNLPDGFRDGPPFHGPARLARPFEAQEMMEAQLELTSALRSGLGNNRFSVGATGLSFEIPAEMNPFDYFADLETGFIPVSAPVASARALGLHRQDIPEMQVAADLGEDAHVAPGAGSGSIGDLQVAHMVQTMAAFGRSQGEAERNNRDRDMPRFDYFA
ncbi:MAG TPA: hypothetical protein VF782_11290, partial [Allosphingosinicella sp.]